MKVKVEVLEAANGSSVSAWGADSKGVTLRQGESAVIEGASISMSGSDGVGSEPISNADTPPAQ